MSIAYKLYIKIVLMFVVRLRMHLVELYIKRFGQVGSGYITVNHTYSCGCALCFRTYGILIFFNIINNFENVLLPL